MKEYQNKYRDKLVIIGVDCKETKVRWRKAVEKMDLPWVHVYNEENTPNDLIKQYAVSHYPTKIVISPEGCILKVSVGEDPGFYKYLDLLLQQ